MKITAVIPTRNRAERLRHTLQSLVDQTRQADEIIVVDSSDEKFSVHLLKQDYAAYPIVWLDSLPSVCLQRNTGIRAAAGNWIFLCDDDIELKTDYLEKLVAYGDGHPACGALTGRLLQLERDRWVDQYPVKSFYELLWRFIFQLSIWGDIQHVRSTRWTRPLYALLIKFYSRRGNHLTLAGWPLITEWKEGVFQTTVYALGASLIKKEWLLGAPYDEILDPYGIGDNYGVALNLPGRQPIHVVSGTSAYHHRAHENRMHYPLVYYRRVLALHYFLKRNKRSGPLTMIVFGWSLCGNSLFFLIRQDYKMFRVTCNALRLIISGKNPYWRGFIKGQTTIQPEY